MNKYVSYSPIFKYKQAYYQVNGSDRRPFYTNLMKRILEQLEAFMSFHSRSFVVIAVLSTKHWTRDNTLISECLSRSIYLLKGMYKLSRVGYVWCREQARSSTQHYHLGLMLDGAKIQFPAKVFEVLKREWKALCGGHVCWPKHCYYHFWRSDLKTFLEIVYRLSYFAKVRTKENTPKFVSMFGTSRIKLK
ncbi:inovirus-type Gp2 protein [Vibrio harveyi]|uniref:YagK/YfjJ domain-containing protein n=1 Tax=Vibrio harveyi TaxID=669 RepID=UPI00390C04C9